MLLYVGSVSCTLVWRGCSCQKEQQGPEEKDLVCFQPGGVVRDHLESDGEKYIENYMIVMRNCLSLALAPCAAQQGASSRVKTEN